MNEQVIGEYLTKCPVCEAIFHGEHNCLANECLSNTYSCHHGVSLSSRCFQCDPNTGVENRLVDETKEMKTWPDLENCTIRELEMFKIGFKHGQEVERKKHVQKG